MNRRLTNAHYRHYYPIKFSYFSDGTDGFLYQSKHHLLLEQIWMTLINPWHIYTNTHICLLRLRTYEGVDLLYKRKSLQGYNIVNFKLEGNIHLLKFLSVSCCWYWLTAFWHLLCYFHITDSYNRQLCVYLYMFPFLTFIFCSFLEYLSLLLTQSLISLYPGHFVRVVCTQGLPSTLFWRKNSSPPIRWIIDEVLASSFSWKQFSKI